MLKRYIIAISLIFLPTPILAENHQSIDPSPNPDSQSLGPSGSGVDSSSSTGAAQFLQPSSPTTLQSLQGADAISGGIPQPTSNSDLQAAGGQATYKDFAGLEADTNARYTPSNSGVQRNYIWLIALAGLAAIIRILPRRFKTENTGL